MVKIIDKNTNRKIICDKNGKSIEDMVNGAFPENDLESIEMRNMIMEGVAKGMAKAGHIEVKDEASIKAMEKNVKEGNIIHWKDIAK